MIVDLHTHRWETPDQLGEAAAERLRSMGEGPWERLHADSAAHERATEAVDVAVVHGFVSEHLGACIDAQQVADYVAHRPDKFIGFAGIDPMSPGHVDEFDKAVDLGLVGVTVSPAAQAFHPTHTSAMALYERCEQLGMPVFVHPDTHLGPNTKLEFAQPYLFDEVARTFPNLPLVFAQVGHPWADQTLTLIGKHPNVYADLSDLTRRPWQLYNVLLLAYQQDAHSHLLLGSDFPFSTPEEAIVTIYSINTLTHGINLPTVPREALRSIVERDALACLGLSAPDASVTVSSDTVAAIEGDTGDERPAAKGKSLTGAKEDAAVVAVASPAATDTASVSHDHAPARLKDPVDAADDDDDGGDTGDGGDGDDAADDHRATPDRGGNGHVADDSASAARKEAR